MRYFEHAVCVFRLINSEPHEGAFNGGVGIGGNRKHASVGELCQQLSGQGVPVPNGFALTAKAYRDSLTAAGAWAGLHALLQQAEAGLPTSILTQPVEMQTQTGLV